MDEKLCDCFTESLGEYGSKIVYCPMHEAAPDLLAALEALLSTQKAYWKSKDMETIETLKAMKEAEKHAHAAIAKAKGIKE